jgi:hypothetical protein
MTLSAFDWSQLSAFAGCIGVVVALTFHIKNLANTRLSNSARMVFDLVHTFDSAVMREHRRCFASALLKDRSSINPCQNTPVLEFFEELGYLTRRGVLDKGMVWNSFFWFIEHYYPEVTKAPSLLEAARKTYASTTLFREIAWLYEQLCKVCTEEEGTLEYEPPSAADIDAFLKDEAR